MDFELRQAKEKWEREQREKKEKARRERDREKKAKEEAAKRQQAIESAQLARRLEEAALTLAAQQRQEEDSWLGDGIVFDKVLRAVAVPGNGDKIRLPASAFEELSSQNAIDKGPMFFEVSVASNNREEEENSKSTHSGVLEFVAREGYVELPPHVWRNSGLAEASLLGQTNARVRYVRLPKGTYAKFQAEGLDFVDVPNHKAVLETTLRQHASLSVGDLLTVQHAGVEYGLRVTELKPGSSVSVLETDMEADVVGGVIDSSQQVGASAQSRLVPLEIGKPQKGVVCEGQYMYFKFKLDIAIANAVAGGESDVLLHLDVVESAEAADADIYVGAHPLLFPTQHNHEWSSHDKGSKVVVLSSSGRQVSASTYSVGVHGYVGKPNFQILVEVKLSAVRQPSAGQKLGSSMVDPSSNQTEEGYGYCGNCKQLVPVAKKVLHEAYCYRHNVLCKEPNCGVVLRKEEMNSHVHCSKCAQALKQDDLAKHMKIFHEPLQCECGEVLEMEEMVNHRANVCPLRSITCRFCGDMVQAGAQADNVRDRLRGLTEHESSCGSRTAPCDSCGRVIMLKEMDLHKAAAHTPSLSTPHPVSVASTPPRPSDGGTDLATSSIRCPICEKKFAGGDATWRLNEHIDAEHWAADPKGEPTAAPMEVENSVSESHVSSVPSTFSNRSKSLSVSCPICGMAVHSERDLSSHIDMVH
ncbi:unnamed protein product [Calypogeia fissa]